MNEKYFLVNGYMPCICTCHKDCLRKDLIHRGYTVFSMERISKKQFDKEVAKMNRKAKQMQREIEVAITSFE